MDARTGRPRRSSTSIWTGCSESLGAWGTSSSIRGLPWGVRTRVDPATQYLMAAAGSSSMEPKLPWPSTSSLRMEKLCAMRTRVS